MKRNYSKRRKSNRVEISPSQKQESNTLLEKVKKFSLTEDMTNTSQSGKDFKSNESNETATHTTKSNPTKTEKTNYKKPIIKHKVLFTISLIFIFFFTAGILIFAPYLTAAYNSYTNGFDTSRIDIDSVPRIYDKDGNLVLLMYGYHDEKSNNVVPTYTSVYTDLSELPKYVGDAFISIEDESFYSNTGISLPRLLYATFNYMVKGDSNFGGSTITQQLVKVATGDDAHSPSRKAREIGSALYLTNHWSKEKILASYLNLVYYGSGAYGIYEASFTYFDTEPKNLNMAQAAVLAALPNSPESLNPYKSEESKERLLNRQKLVLEKMLELGFITQEEHDEALKFNIEFKNGSSKIPKNDPAVSQYLKLALTQSVDLIETKYGFDQDKAEDFIFSNKASLYLNMDTQLQKKVYDSAVSIYSDYDKFEVGSVMTTKSGEVLAIVASRTGSEVDHAYKMTRQTGSAIKPVSVYSPAYDMGLIEPTSYVYDGPVSVKSSSGVWHVHNADRSYHGGMTINNAVAYSYNTIAVITLEKVGLTNSLNYVRSFGITTVDEHDLYYPALGIGGFTYGVSPYELTQAYNVFNNDGVYRNITTIKKIVIDGTVLVPERNEHQVISKSANDKMKVSLHAVADYGTGRTAVPSLGLNAYLKTGTTDGRKDIWTCGFTDDVTSCIWGGYDTPKTTPVGNLNKLWKQSIESYYVR